MVQPEPAFPKQVGGYDGEGDQQDGLEFREGEPGGAEQAAAVIDEQKLYPGDQGHDSDERGVAYQMGQQVEPVGARIEAVEDTREDKKV